MLNLEQLNAWLDKDNEGLVATVVSDIKCHVEKLHSSGVLFYGYAAMPDDYCQTPNPTNFMVAYNRESDVQPENSNDAYFRYSVDEWRNYESEGFDATNAKLAARLRRFREIHTISNEGCVIDEFESAFKYKTNSAILTALLESRQNHTFAKDIFLVVWLSDSDDEIINESVKVLNEPEQYERFSSVGF